LDKHRQALCLQHLSDVIVITEQASIYGKRLMNKNEPFAVFLGKAFPPPEITICLEKGSTEGEGFSIHVDDDLEISFHRTVRLPNDGKTYALPAGLGKFPTFDSQDFGQRLPVDMREKGGVILPMWRTYVFASQQLSLISVTEREALWIRFLYKLGNNMAYAIRPFVGGVNAISGKIARPNMSTMLRSLNRVDRAQDYIVVQQEDQSRAQWLDGIAVAPGVVRQFVALPIGSRESIEWQMTGVNDVGGMQLEIIPQYPTSQIEITRFDVMPRNRDIGRIAMGKGDLLTTPADLGIDAGIPVYMGTDSPRPRTLLDELNRSGNLKSNRLRLCVDKAQTITIKVVDNSDEHFCRIHGSTCLLPVMQDFCTTRGNDPNTFTFTFDRQMIRDRDTADSLGMEDGDCVEVFQNQIGGGWSDPRWNISHLEAPAQGFGAGAQIFQNINPDKQDPRSWNTDAAKLLNIQVLNLEVFERIMGMPPPSTPISLATYRQAGIPFLEGYRETNSPIHGNFNRVVALDDLDKMDRGSPSETILNLLHAGRCKVCGRTVNSEKLCPSCDNDHEFSCTPSPPSHRNRHMLALQPVEAEWERFESIVDLASLTLKDPSAPKVPSEAVCLPTGE
jgi:hypothetical protein